MALLNKLFFPTSTSSTSLPATGSAVGGNANATSSCGSGSSVNRNRRQQNNNQPVHSKNYLSQFPFDGRQVRVLLYRECDRSGRKLLFDSNALQKVPLKEANGNVTKTERFTIHRHGHSNSKHQTYKAHSSNNFIEVCDEYGYKLSQPNTADFTSIGEMVFGALAMSFRGTSFKVHWLPEPLRILCSQVFLTPVGSANSHSPYSTISMNSLATPRTSISSEHGSIDGFSLSSYSIVPYSMCNSRQLSLTPSDRGSCPLDVPDQQSLTTNSESGPRFSSTYSNATDSGYDGMSRSQMSSDQWSASYPYSTRSSLGSVTSEQLDALNKLSMEAAYFSVPGFDDTASDGSLQRRISRNLRTSFEHEHAMNDLIGYISDNFPGTATAATNCGGSEGGNMGIPNYRRASYSANESRSNPEIGRRREAGCGKPVTRRAKLGLAVCITMSESFEEEMEVFCSEHIALLESMLSRLRASTERAYINHKEFLQIMFHAWQETQQWFNDLFTAPRIKCPIWLSITTSGNKYSKSVAEKFMKELCWLLSLADTKDTNFFVSTMLTAILTHHLGWVCTVAAFNSSSTRAETSAAAIEQRAKLLQVSQKHPYNALWAQMGDLYGAIGVPTKLARTVIYGTEKLAVERLLNILTYFIRCGEVRRTAKREDFNKEMVSNLVCQRKNEILKKSAHSSSNVAYQSRFGGGGLKKSGGGGMIRTQTSKFNLNTISDGGELSDEGIGGEDENTEEPNNEQLLRTLRTSKKNEIPNVLAFRDSRFVQQELRIGNYLMDTGIEKKSLLKQSSSTSSSSFANDKDGRIRVLITTPDNEQKSVEDESSLSGSNVEDGAVEAIEIEANDGPPQAGVVESGKRSFFWQVVKEGVSLDDLHRSEKLGECAGAGTASQLSAAQRRQSHLSLSDLITQNSMGKSDRMTWGMEPRRDTVSLEEEIHFEACQKIIEREHGNSVVFTLGDNEPLVNIKKSNEDLTVDPDASNKSPTSGQQSLCALHQRTHGATLSKRHSGVKFNFQQYPQIATNYMKSKNLMMSNYDLLMDKCSKLEAQEAGFNTATLLPTNCQNFESITEATADTISASSSSTTTAASNTDCLVCNSILNSYQTPSNATELEFETDEVRSPQTTNAVASSGSARTLQTVSSAASIATLKSATNEGETLVESSTTEQPATPTGTPGGTPAMRQKTYNSNVKRVSSQRGSISSVAAKCAAVNEAVHLLKLPVPGVKELPQDDDPSGDGMKLRAGFIPSLFLNITDHYVPDMVLQGTCAPPDKWHVTLREDLALAARAASLISLPAENVAIVADMEKWDVRLISSQMPHFQYDGEQSTPVGMSQLVSSMLETVQAMNSAGISAYECLAFLESKMQEIYLQSESLAAYLLETDFCSLSTVTTALNLAENDVPLLLSIASIHTPQIGKKCGISFR